MEASSLHTRFIITCNYAEKIIPAIVSRCHTFEIKPLSKKEVAVKLATILSTEKVSYTQEDIVFCVNTYYPDIRKVINFAQQSNVDGTIKISKQNAIESDTLNKLVDLLKTPSKPGTFNEIRQIAADIDPNSIETVYRYLFDKIDVFAKGKELVVIVELGDAVNSSVHVIPRARDITFASCMGKIIQHLK
jgi:DNA polymerase III delta prime subunit